VKFDLLGLDDAVRRDVVAVAGWRRFDRGVVLFHEGTYPSVDRLLVEYLAAQVRRLSERLTEALCFEARTRVLRRLLDLDAVFDSGPVPVTQEEISTMAGTTRPTVNRVMQDLAEAGIIELRRGRFIVVDSTALARAAR